VFLLMNFGRLRTRSSRRLFITDGISTTTFIAVIWTKASVQWLPINWRRWREAGRNQMALKSYLRFHRNKPLPCSTSVVLRWSERRWFSVKAPTEVALLFFRVQGGLLGFKIGDGLCNQRQGDGIVRHFVQASEVLYLSVQRLAPVTHVPTQFRPAP